jgi:hypothetical protein
MENGYRLKGAFARPKNRSETGRLYNVRPFSPVAAAMPSLQRPFIVSISERAVSQRPLWSDFGQAAPTMDHWLRDWGEQLWLYNRDGTEETAVGRALIRNIRGSGDAERRRDGEHGDRIFIIFIIYDYDLLLSTNIT